MDELFRQVQDCIAVQCIRQTLVDIMVAAMYECQGLMQSSAGQLPPWRQSVSVKCFGGRSSKLNEVNSRSSAPLAAPWVFR